MRLLCRVVSGGVDSQFEIVATVVFVISADLLDTLEGARGVQQDEGERARRGAGTERSLLQGKVIGKYI